MRAPLLRRGWQLDPITAAAAARSMGAITVTVREE